MKSITYKIPVGDRKPNKKKWWQIWRKKGDSAEEILADMMSYYKGEINLKQFDRLSSIRKIYNIELDPMEFKKEYWFPNR